MRGTGYIRFGVIDMGRWLRCKAVGVGTQYAGYALPTDLVRQVNIDTGLVTGKKRRRGVSNLLIPKIPGGRETEVSTKTPTRGCPTGGPLSNL